MTSLHEPELSTAQNRAALPRNVKLLGWASCLNDVASEMIFPLLPLFLTSVLGGSKRDLGLIEGAADTTSNLLKLGMGAWSDRLRHRRMFVVVGYLLSAVARPLASAVGAPVQLLAVRLADRFGKGIRTAPRDAIIAASTPKDQFGTAFGAHRALDTAGAMLGPLIASALLAFTANAYDAIFVVSFCFALVGFAVLTLFVQNRRTTDDVIEGSPAKVKTIAPGDVARLLAEPHFRGIALIGGLFSLTTLSDPLLHLNFQRSLNFGIELVPLLFVAVALIYMLLAVPFGRLADRFGRGLGCGDDLLRTGCRHDHDAVAVADDHVSRFDRHAADDDGKADATGPGAYAGVRRDAAAE